MAHGLKIAGLNRQTRKREGNVRILGKKDMKDQTRFDLKCVACPFILIMPSSTL